MTLKRAVFMILMLIFLGTNIPHSLVSAMISYSDVSMIYLYGDTILTAKKFLGISLYSVADPENPEYCSMIYLDTLHFAVKNNYLFADSKNSLYIYDISNKEYPEKIGQFTHATSCDPVVSYDDKAYITLRAGNNCGNNQSELDIVDISDLTDPFLLSIYLLVEPYGLAVDEKYAYVCDGKSGFKQLDVSNPEDIEEVNHLNFFPAFDVIKRDSILYILSDQRIYLYRITDGTSLEKITFFIP